jgi:hypothetical protein
MESEEIAVSEARNQVSCTAVWIELIVGLMDDHAAWIENAECGVMDAARNQNRNDVEGATFKQHLADFLAIGIKPLANVLNFYTGIAGVLVVYKKVESFPARYAAAAERGRGVLLTVLGAVVMLLKIEEIANIVEFGLSAQSA